MVLIGVDVDPGESAGKISGWADRVGLTWPLAAASNGPLSDYRITQQSAAVGIDASGEIVLRKNGGLQNEAKWREWLDTLAGPTASAEPQAPSAAVSSSTTDSTVGAAAAAPTTAPAQPTAVTAPPDPTAIIAAPPAAPPPTAIPVPTTAPPPPTAVPAPPPTAVPAPPPPPTATPRPAPTATAVPTATPNIPVGHNVGQRAPDFTVTAVSGETITLSEVTASGKAVLIYFFATW